MNTNNIVKMRNNKSLNNQFNSEHENINSVPFTRNKNKKAFKQSIRKARIAKNLTYTLATTTVNY